jgi:hypothetical protein
MMNKRTRIEEVVIADETKRSIAIFVPGDSILEYVDFLNEIIAEGASIYDEEKELKHIARMKSVYTPAKDIRRSEIYETVIKGQTKELPCVEVYHLIPKKFVEKEELKAISDPMGNPLADVIMGAYYAAPHLVNATYKIHNVKADRLSVRSVVSTSDYF